MKIMRHSSCSLQHRCLLVRSLLTSSSQTCSIPYSSTVMSAASGGCVMSAIVPCNFQYSREMKASTSFHGPKHVDLVNLFPGTFRFKQTSGFSPYKADNGQFVRRLSIRALDDTKAEEVKETKEELQIRPSTDAAQSNGTATKEALPCGDLEYQTPGGWDEFVTKCKMPIAFPWQRVKKGSVLKLKLSGSKTRQEEDEEEDALAEVALEALFAQLEKDLEDGAMSEDDNDDEDFTEEEVIALEDELEAALMGLDYEQQTAIHVEAGKSAGGASKSKHLLQEDDELVLDDEEEDEEEQRVVSLETWQLKKLAAAAEMGRRNINVKALAAEVGMDRSDVLAWLKNPPPELLMLGATMGFEEDSEDAEKVHKDSDGAASSTIAKISTSSKKQNSESQGFVPETWYNQKRLRKEHVATFERVFRRTKRPTNAMIQNLVELTHVPRKRIVEWFDNKRQEVEPSQSLEPLR